MKIIEWISELIEDEIDGAKTYAKKSAKYKEENPELAKTLYDISLDEIKHVNMLHENVVKLIKEYREKNGEPPANMIAIYDYLHEKQIDKINEVKQYQELYKY